MFNGTAQDENGNDISYSHDEAVAKIESWIVEDGFATSGLNELRAIVDYPEITDKINQNKNIVESQLRVKGIPTMIFDGKRHTGLWQADE
jgi:hypothetical protein